MQSRRPSNDQETNSLLHKPSSLSPSDIKSLYEEIKNLESLLKEYSDCKQECKEIKASVMEMKKEKEKINLRELEEEIDRLEKSYVETFNELDCKGMLTNIKISQNDVRSVLGNISDPNEKFKKASGLLKNTLVSFTVGKGKANELFKGGNVNRNSGNGYGNSGNGYGNSGNGYGNSGNGYGNDSFVKIIRCSLDSASVFSSCENEAFSTRLSGDFRLSLKRELEGTVPFGFQLFLNDRHVYVVFEDFNEESGYEKDDRITGDSKIRSDRITDDNRITGDSKIRNNTPSRLSDDSLHIAPPVKNYTFSNFLQKFPSLGNSIGMVLKETLLENILTNSLSIPEAKGNSEFFQDTSFQIDNLEEWILDGIMSRLISLLKNDDPIGYGSVSMRGSRSANGIDSHSANEMDSHSKNRIDSRSANEMDSQSDHHRIDPSRHRYEISRPGYALIQLVKLFGSIHSSRKAKAEVFLNKAIRKFFDTKEYEDPYLQYSDIHWFLISLQRDMNADDVNGNVNVNGNMNVNVNMRDTNRDDIIHDDNGQDTLSSTIQDSTLSKITKRENKILQNLIDGIVAAPVNFNQPDLIIKSCFKERLYDFVERIEKILEDPETKSKVEIQFLSKMFLDFYENIFREIKNTSLLKDNRSRESMNNSKDNRRGDNRSNDIINNRYTPVSLLENKNSLIDVIEYVLSLSFRHDSDKIEGYQKLKDLLKLLRVEKGGIKSVLGKLTISPGDAKLICEKFLELNEEYLN